LFAKQMLDSMRATLNNGHALLNGGMAEEIFQDMLYDEYARMMARTGSLGIADMIVRQYENAVEAGGIPPEHVAALYESL
jgi:peptidoglycan hydrolase FlgJ